MIRNSRLTTDDSRLPKGFTLVEAVLSIAFIGVGIVGILYAYQGAARSALMAEQTVVATNIARGTIERIVHKRLQDSYSAAVADINSGVYDENPVSGFTGYVLDSSVTEVDSDDDDAVDDFLDTLASSGYARVTVQVSWNGGASSIRLVTVIADYITL